MRRVGVAVAGLVGLMACGAEGSSGEAAAQPPPAPVARLHGVVFDGYRGDSRNLQLTAGSADVDWGAEEVFLDRVRIVLPEEQPGPLSVRAARGRIDLRSRGFVLEGGVVASTPEGERFETRSLRYLPDRNVLVSDDPVTVRGRRLDLVGTGLELDVATRQVRVLGPVRARTEP